MYCICKYLSIIFKYLFTELTMSDLQMEMKRENFDSSVQDPLQIPSDSVQKSEEPSEKESKNADEILICEPKIEDIQG